MLNHTALNFIAINLRFIPLHPFMSSRIWQSLSLGSGRHHFKEDDEWETEVDTSARQRLIRVRGRGGHECEFTQDMSVRSHRIQVCVRGKCEAVTITCRTYTHYLYISSSSFGCSQQPFLTTNYANWTNFFPCGENKYGTKHLRCDEWHEWDFPCGSLPFGWHSWNSLPLAASWNISLSTWPWKFVSFAKFVVKKDCLEHQKVQIIG